uniref:Cytochrome c biogenesis protein CcsA n=1 Tax=Lobosphaera incisa TaxID=312850 RepID=A0A097KM10_9CHLO|nr:heme attachment to plastid cytochrome c [Lobosphaera incisa]AIT94212.1 heme attachment to plastid cytochrome c [Lobosphaera incisa]
MTYLEIEAFLEKSSFLLLFSTMLFYWIRTTFFLSTNFNVIGSIGNGLANLCLALLLIQRWVVFGHFPLSNLYESLIFLSWSMTSIILFLEKMNDNFLIGALLSPIALFINAFATLSLPAEMQKANLLVPALQSNWLMMHVTIMMLSYAALISGCLLSITFLVITSIKTNQLVISNQQNATQSLDYYAPEGNNSLKSAIFTEKLETSMTPSLLSYPHNNNWFKQIIFLKSLKKINLSGLDTSTNLPNEFNSRIQEKNDLTIGVISNTLLNLSQYLDNLSYRILGIGFSLLTIGILSGAVWANEAWGSYWSWDPKETWAFITWLIFAIYLHTRLIKGWQGKKPAAIASIGFFVVWICYLGVNLLGKGLHSYGWVSVT